MKATFFSYKQGSCEELKHLNLRATKTNIYIFCYMSYATT